MNQQQNHEKHCDDEVTTYMTDHVKIKYRDTEDTIYEGRGQYV